MFKHGRLLSDRHEAPVHACRPRFVRRNESLPTQITNIGGQINLFIFHRITKNPHLFLNFY
ncbi:hypothetical protein M703_08175 [Neisseria gonorrhoeae SK29344]|nr:hypothetical protein M685_09200 [Neisseria gonorrhoeae SK16259]KLS09084.1 hypothetical protein M716_02965 [Neisseria gonorrhoeae SK32402]KLS10134.1 hypothetical protein M703_08175 [Neisseria gonorrhoeae SK29344]KLS24951.1 hypothetical protein M733_00450 [Neisseria gonorrhoeae ATL_2011_05-13]KLS60232.1 hypothetical protein M742_01570 [Neisseria gonorrhoeae NYC_2011_05_07]KLS75355.1 hypothetical protein M771_05345 [Neisseria gonorrhoeae MU_NG1]KLS91238.1 hypothetical protein M775_10345 [Neis